MTKPCRCARCRATLAGGLGSCVLAGMAVAVHAADASPPASSAAARMQGAAAPARQDVRTVTGTVLENQRFAHLDGPSVLVVDVAGVRWDIVYAPGEGEQAGFRDDIFRLASPLARGARIRATGLVAPSQGGHVLHLRTGLAVLQVLGLSKPE